MKKPLIIAVVAVILIVAAVLFVPKYKLWEKNNTTVKSADQVTALKEAILNKKCAEAVGAANTFLEKQPANAEVWLLKGACEFNLGKTAEAKASFQKTLELDPSNEPAKNYLSAMEEKPGVVNVTPAIQQEYGVSETDFESRLGINPEPLTFVFKEAMRVPNAGEHFKEMVVGTYQSSLNETAIKKYFTDLFTSYKLKFTSAENSGITSFNVTISEKRNYSLSILAGASPDSPASVTFTYASLK
jgi:tetratricopeptide (TPR) repeat protein